MVLKDMRSNRDNITQPVLAVEMCIKESKSGYNMNFCGDMSSRANEIQLSLAILQLSPALEKPSITWHVKAYFLGQVWMPDRKACTRSQK